MINKPCVIITSLGRTGTLFFKELYQCLYPEGTVLHEPDYFNFGQYRNWDRRIAESIKQIQQVGFNNIVLKKLAGKWSLIDISHARITGKMTRGQAAAEITTQRKKFLESRPGSIYVESSSAWFGLLDTLDDTFVDYRVVFIVRNGLDWVRSKMNFGNMYKKGIIQSVLSYNWPTPQDVERDPAQDPWSNRSRFEKICWAWQYLNNYALSTIRDNPNVRVARFEDIFLSDQRIANLGELIAFTDQLQESRDLSSEHLAELLERKVHSSEGHFPSAKNWSDQQLKIFLEICGSAMSTLGYSDFSVDSR